jgi:replicative DNA helicase Mcm
VAVEVFGKQDPISKFEEIFSLEKYRRRLSEMLTSGRSAFTLDFEDILSRDFNMAVSLINDPEEYLKYARDAALRRLQTLPIPFMEERIESLRESGLTVRLSPLPDTVPLRDIGSEHIGKLVTVEGIIVRATPVQPMVTMAAFTCVLCGQINYVEQTGPFLKRPFRCGNPTCRGSRIFEFDEGKSKYIDCQSLRIQERPEELPPGQTPTQLDVKAVGSDLKDVIRPGDQVKIVGVVRTTSQTLPKAGRLRTLKTYLDANNIISVSKESATLEITPEDEEKIRALGRDPNIYEKLKSSIAPSIHGLDHVKEACLLLLLGGVPKKLPDMNIRGDLNVLLIGDPATAKSQILQYVARIAPRGLYTSGRGTTAAGLTASVIRDEHGEVSLEAGAMVLADRGVVCIDEFEKMRPEDRTAMHTAMEQQVVSIAKAGIVATLNARTSVLAAANPQYGRYVPERTVLENIDLPITILSRFDLIFILRDEPNETEDSERSKHVLSLHMAPQKTSAPPPISQDLLRKYIAYARNIRPTLMREAAERIGEYYMAMRKASSAGSIAITLRQLETLIRLSEARAKAALKTTVTVEDVEVAIRLIEKFLNAVGIDVQRQVPDIDTIMTGKPKSIRDMLMLIRDVLLELERKEGDAIKEELLKQELVMRGLSRAEIERYLAQLIREGTIYSPRPGYLKKT